MERNYHDEAMEGVGDPAKEKNLGERPVSDEDVDPIRDDLVELNDDLRDLRARERGDLRSPPSRPE